ncbi:MAG TPA: hypothetical protein VFU02_17190 [Polyangiaceae bacterium]|nr:hypothetical protein [Polyangiaceae bacterium]
MAKFYVWDEFNETREDADEVDAFSDPETVAEFYAEHDTDGNIDGVYSGSGHTICVEDEAGKLWRFTVTVDYDPTYWATEIKPATDAGSGEG